MTQIDDIATLGVVGAGTMGTGIAQVAAVSGFDVVVFDAAEGATARAVDRIAASLARQVERGRIAADAVEPALARIRVADSLDGLSVVDAVVEAIIEDRQIKQETFHALAGIVKPTTLLGTNTSTIPITEIAGRAEWADRLIGMHFFSPVPAMPLCEIIRGLSTSDETVERTQALAEALGKTPIIVNRDSAGFVTSRLIVALTLEAIRIVEEGLASPKDVDLACTLGFGHKMGPLETADLTGVDIPYYAAKAMYEVTGNPQFAPPQLLGRMVAAGHLGQKSGQGFYDHTGGTA